MQARILSLSANPEIGKLRAMVLRQAGYYLTWPSSKQETDRILQDESFEILLIGHTISGQSARNFAETFRVRNPNRKVIAIMATSYLTVTPDKTVKAIDGPEALLEAIDEVLGPGQQTIR
jgi:DNA-binding response OmpR family regulator